MSDGRVVRVTHTGSDAARFTGVDGEVGDGARTVPLCRASAPFIVGQSRLFRVRRSKRRRSVLQRAQANYFEKHRVLRCDRFEKDHRNH